LTLEILNWASPISASLSNQQSTKHRTGAGYLISLQAEFNIGVTDVCPLAADIF